MKKKFAFYGIIVGFFLGLISIFFSDINEISTSDGFIALDATQQESHPLVAVAREHGIINKQITHSKKDQTNNLSKQDGIDIVHGNNIDIANVFFDQTISNQTLNQLIKASISANREQDIDVLLDVLVSLSAQYGYNPRSQLVVDILTETNSVDVAKKISDYLVNAGNISPELENAMIGIVNSVTNREEMAAYIEEQFILSTDNNAQEKLLAIGHPESLGKIANFSLMQGNNSLYTKVIDRLESNPYAHTFNVLLSMNNNQNITYIIDQIPIMEVAQQWSYHQLSGSRLDFIENQLAQGSILDHDKSLVLKMLQYSEDQKRSREIIYKFWKPGEI